MDMGVRKSCTVCLGGVERWGAGVGGNRAGLTLTKEEERERGLGWKSLRPSQGSSSVLVSRPQGSVWVPMLCPGREKNAVQKLLGCHSS